MKVRKHTSLEVEDAEFLASRNIKIAHIVRQFCERLRAEESGQLQESIASLRDKNEKTRARLQKIMDVISSELDEETFNKIWEKI